MNKRIKYIDLFFLLYIPLYLIGLALPFVYTLLIYARDGWKIMRQPKVLPIILIIVYIISLLFSIRFEFFTIDRFSASVHNLIVLMFIPIGYYIGSSRRVSLKYINAFLGAIIVFFVPYILISLFVDFNLSYNGILAFLSENKYTRVVFSMPYYLENWKYSRIQFLAPYPTATAFFLVALNTYRNAAVKENLKIDFFDVGVLAIVLFTGARFLLVVIALQIALKILVRNTSLLKLTLLLIPLIVIIGINLAVILLESRAGSNNMRIKIYVESFKMLIDESPIIGIGIKPKIPEVLGIYPLGSHSTFNTFFFKTGFLGGILFLLIYFKTLIDRLKKGIQGLLKNDNEKLFIAASQILFLLAIIFDDVDSDEFYAFCFGLVLGLRKV